MKLDQGPSFRKIVKPWYESTAFYAVISVFMVLVFLFSNVGFHYTLTHEQYWSYRWIPLILMALSTVVVVINLTRLILRIIKRVSEEEE
jgi:uncharacterized membrane protein